jgi:hypothetical protein
MVGPLLVLLGGPAQQLTSASPCTGGVDLVAIVAARQWPDAAIGNIAFWMFIATAFAALGFFAQFVNGTTGSTPLAAAITVTIGIAMLAPGASGLPWILAAFGSCALAALAIRPFVERALPPRRSAALACAALLIAASVVPAWIPGCTAAAVAVIWQTPISSAKRVLASAIAVIALCVVPLSILAATQTAGLVHSISWSACVWSTNAHGGRLAALGSLVDLAGPIVLALAALGLWTATTGIGSRPVVGICLVLALATVPGLGDGWPAPVILAPVLFGIWACAALGLRETVRAFGSSRRQAVGMALVVFLLPFLHWTIVRAQANGSILSPEGHGRASLRLIRSVLNLLPPGSSLVEEDAMVETLVRAARFGRRPAKALALVSRDRVAVLDALRTSAVYAFPAGQRELTLRGFIVEPVEGPIYPGGRLRGVSAVTGSRACAELQNAWVDLSRVAASGRIALSARSERAEGPVVFYFTGTTAYLPGPDHWPNDARRGFHVRIFGRGTPEESARLEAEAAENGLQGNAVFNAPFVARLTVYRTAHAPLTLPIALGPPRAHGIGRLTADYPGALPLTVCDAPTITIVGF